MAKNTRLKTELRQKTSLRTTTTYRLVLGGSTLAVAVLFGIGVFMYGNFGNNKESLAASAKKDHYKREFRATSEPDGPTNMVANITKNDVLLKWVNSISDKKNSETDGILILRKAGIVADNQPINELETDSIIHINTINGWNIVYNSNLDSSFTDKNIASGIYTYLVYEKNNGLKYTSPKNAARVFVFNGTGLSATITTDTKVDGLTIPASSTLTIDEKAELTIRENASVNIGGTLILKGEIANNASSWTFANGAHFVYDRNSNGKKNGIPVAKWETGSTCEVTGVTGSEPHGLNQSFENFTWNCNNQTSDVTFPDNFTVNGNLAIQSTGDKKVKTIWLDGTSTFKGNVAVNDDSAKVNAKKKSLVVFNGATNQTINGTWNFQTVSFSNTNAVENAGTISVNKALTLENGTVKNPNENSFKIADEAIIVRKNGSFNGRPSFAGVYDLTYLAPVTTGDEISAYSNALRNLTISCDGNVALGKTANINGTLEFINGKIVTADNEVNVKSTSNKSIKGYTENSYVAGNLRRSVNGKGNYNFPVGNATNLEVINVELSKTNGFTSILAQFVNKKPVVTSVSTDLRLNGTIVSNMLDAGYWSLTTNSPITAGTCNVTLNEKGNTNKAPSTRCYCVVRKDNTSPAWQFLGKHSNKTQSVENGVVIASRSELTSLGDFAIAYSGASILLSRSVLKVSGSNEFKDIVLATNTELGDPTIIVERSADAITYEAIGEMQNTTAIGDMLEFKFRDLAPIAGTSYYRVKETTVDGTISYSDAQFTTNDAKNNASINSIEINK